MEGLRSAKNASLTHKSLKDPDAFRQVLFPGPFSILRLFQAHENHLPIFKNEGNFFRRIGFLHQWICQQTPNSPGFH
jgi:hypothetical protein